LHFMCSVGGIWIRAGGGGRRGRGATRTQGRRTCRIRSRVPVSLSMSVSENPELSELCNLPCQLAFERSGKVSRENSRVHISWRYRIAQGVSQSVSKSPGHTERKATDTWKFHLLAIYLKYCFLKKAFVF